MIGPDAPDNANFDELVDGYLRAFNSDYMGPATLAETDHAETRAGYWFAMRKGDDGIVWD